jgi:hypothetical protein
MSASFTCHVYLWRRTLPRQMSSTSAGSRLDLTMTCFNSLTSMPSSGVSFKPPLCAFVSGVRTASVMTMSSGFLVVLLRTH